METIVRHVERGEWEEAFGVLGQLRDHLTPETFRSRYFAQLRSGYELFAAVVEERIVGLIGLRPVCTFARGYYLTVDDLVVDEGIRRHGVGRALMDFAMDYAKTLGMEAVFLSARKEAISFYEKRGFVYHQAPSMKFLLQKQNR